MLSAQRVTAAALAATVLACSAGGKSQFGGSEGAGATSGADGGGGGDISVGSGSGGNMGDQIGCSGDLQNVIDGAGNVVEACAPDKGCSGGMCVEICQAAADSQGNVGCDFMVATPHFYVGILPPCFAMFVANNWPKDALLTAEWNGTEYDVTSFGRIPNTDPTAANWPAVPATGLPPGEVAVLFLSQDPNSVNGGPLTCPVTPAVSQANGTAVQGTGKGLGWHVTSDVPVSAYDMLPFGGALSYLPSAELVLPTTAWGDNYIAVLPREPNSGGGPPWGQVLAYENGTTVDLLPTVALPAGTGVSPAPANVTTSFSLNAGEYIQWQIGDLGASGGDMTGTVLQSNKPVAFTGGNGYQCYTSATSSGGGCDSGHQATPPIAALGSEYVAPPYGTRIQAGQPESIPYRLVGAVDGTVLTYDPPVPGAPASLGVAQKVDFETTLAFTVTSQDADHPFYVGQIMSGCYVTGGNPSGCAGDEDFVNILPPAQFLSKYVFFSDPTYPTTNLVFVRSSAGGAFADVTLECLGTIGPWTPVGTAGKYEVASVYVIKDSVPQGACSNGPQVASSEGPFGVMVWGLSEAASYGYPAGGSVAPINTVVVSPIPR